MCDIVVGDMNVAEGARTAHSWIDSRVGVRVKERNKGLTLRSKVVGLSGR